MESRVASVPAARGVAAPHDEVGKGDEILTPRNFFPFKKHLLRVCLRKHGEIGRIIADGVVPDIPKPPVPPLLDGANKHLTIEQEAAKTEYLEQVKLAVSMRSDMAKEKTRMFGTLLGSIGEESRMNLEGHPDWDATSNSYDPARLWALIKSTHIGSVTGVKSEDRRTARRQYEELRQGKTVSVSAFCQFFIHAVARLSEASVDLPQEDQAADFLEKLDSARFGALKSEIRSAAVRGIKEAPATLHEAMRVAVTWAGHVDAQNSEDARGAAAKRGGPVGDETDQKGSEEASGSVFTAKKSSGAPRGVCKLCKEAGHYVLDCPQLEEFSEYLEEKKKQDGDKKGAKKQEHSYIVRSKPLDAIF